MNEFNMSNMNEVIMAVAWLNELAIKTKNGNPEEYIISSSDALYEDYKTKVVYDENKLLERIYEGKRYAICLDNYSYYNEETTGIKGKFSVVISDFDKDDESYVKPYIEVELDEFENNSIIIENGKWYAL